MVAMQYAIPDNSAVIFSRTLYRALADGWPLDAAVTEGRKAISARVTEDDMDWGIPVLFMRSSDGILWVEEPEEMVEKATAPEADAGVSPQIVERSGGVNIYGPTSIGGDVVGGDKIVYGGQEGSDKME